MRNTFTDFAIYHKVGHKVGNLYAPSAPSAPDAPSICLWLDDADGDDPSRERTYHLSENEARRLASHLMMHADECWKARKRRETRSAHRN